MAKSGGGTRGYAKRHGFRVGNVPSNQTRMRAKYKYVVTGGPVRGSRMYAQNMREVSSLMRGAIRARRDYERR